MNIKARVDWLVEQIRYHNHKYYVEASPEITDEEYDMLVKELKLLEEKYPEFAYSNSPTTEVGSDLMSKLSTVKHRFKMQSLDNVFNETEWNEYCKRDKFDKDTEFYIDTKLDGLALELLYENGNLIRAVTRGDGVSGEDVTLNALRVNNIPLDIPFKNTIDTRGEVIMLRDD